MITGVHGLFYSRQAEAVRAFLRDKLDWKHVDSGGGWLIFALPPTEFAVHPTDGEPSTEIYLMCDDITATRTELEAKGIEFTEPITDAGWGLVTRIRIAEDETLGIYEPRHASPLTS
jgi:hypothetical protein